jgi:hypothetical protein
MPMLQGACDPTLSVRSDGPALLVNDEAVLSRFPLERMLDQLIHLSAADATMTPAELLQTLFDTAGDRAEGGLARSSGLLDPVDPDFFAPVAIVNRFDLLPAGAETCGEYRIVYAKASGRTDPGNRVLLILEAALPNPSGNIAGCRPVARAWDALEDQDEPDALADRLEEIFFDGPPGFRPIVHPEHYGALTDPSSAYGVTRGQVRVALGMQEPFELRELRLVSTDGITGKRMWFEPSTVKSNPLPGLFADSPESSADVSAFRSDFVSNGVERLAAGAIARIRLPTMDVFNAQTSPVAGPAAPGYASVVIEDQATQVIELVEARIEAQQLNDACPPNDPLTAVDILRRASLQACAGCHAPHRVLDADQRIGCGLAWPDTPGAHVDELGRLSPALVEVFLPHRAQVMTTFLQACDPQAIGDNLQRTP